jgi:phosphatidylserine decarboxylase
MGVLGAPFMVLLDWPMYTPSGYAFFLRQDVNEKIKIILNTWRDRVLMTSKSRYVITTDDGGWLCEEALAAIEKDAQTTDEPCYRFQDLFECDPEGDAIHWGFKSWDDFLSDSSRISINCALSPIRATRSGW